MEFPVPVVRLILVNKDNQCLILKRSSSEYKSGLWCLPGGKIDYGYTIEQAIRKELKEETSLECISYKFLFYQDSLPLEPGKMHCINLYFVCTYAGQLVLNEESSDYAWIEQSELSQYKITFLNDAGLLYYWNSKTNA